MIKDKIDERVRSEPFDLECQCDANAVIEETKEEIDRIGIRVSNPMHDGTTWSVYSGYSNGQGTSRMFWPREDEGEQKRQGGRMKQSQHEQLRRLRDNVDALA